MFLNGIGFDQRLINLAEALSIISKDRKTVTGRALKPSIAILLVRLMATGIQSLFKAMGKSLLCWIIGVLNAKNLRPLAVIQC
jgi:hypothetical protein